MSLAISAPCGPPADSAGFLARLDSGWLATAHASDPAALAAVRSSAKQITDVALRFRALFRRLGTGLDGPGSFDDADVWYCILEGTAETAVAEAQAKALVELLAWYAARPGAFGRGSGTGRGPERRDPAGGGRVQRGVAAGHIWQAVRTGPLARPGRPGVRAVLAGPGAVRTTTGTGSRVPRTAASGCCAPRFPTPSANWPAAAGWWTPPGGCSAGGCGAVTATRVPTTPAWSTRHRALARRGTGGLHLPRRRHLPAGQAPARRRRRAARPAAGPAARPAVAAERPPDRPRHQAGTRAARPPGATGTAARCRAAARRGVRAMTDPQPRGRTGATREPARPREPGQPVRAARPPRQRRGDRRGRAGGLAADRGSHPPRPA